LPNCERTMRSAADRSPPRARRDPPRDVGSESVGLRAGEISALPFAATPVLFPSGPAELRSGRRACPAVPQLVGDRGPPRRPSWRTRRNLPIGACTCGHEDPARQEACARRAPIGRRLHALRGRSGLSSRMALLRSRLNRAASKCPAGRERTRFSLLAASRMVCSLYERQGRGRSGFPGPCPCAIPAPSRAFATAAKGVSSAILERTGRPGEDRLIAVFVGTPRSRFGCRDWRRGEGKRAWDRSRSDAGTDPGIRTSKQAASQRTKTGEFSRPVRLRPRRLGPPRSHRP
jgi:hypothetical protein